jgi:hypothetical protein
MGNPGAGDCSQVIFLIDGSGDEARVKAMIDDYVIPIFKYVICESIFFLLLFSISRALNDRATLTDVLAQTPFAAIFRARIWYVASKGAHLLCGYPCIVAWNA